MLLRSGKSMPIIENQPTQFGHFSEEVLCEIIFTKCLSILTYGMECFELLGEQKP